LGIRDMSSTIAQIRSREALILNDVLHWKRPLISEFIPIPLIEPGFPSRDNLRDLNIVGIRLWPVRGGLPCHRREAPGRSPRRGVPPRQLPASAAVCGWV